MYIKRKLILLFAIPLLAFSAHKYYLSLTQLNYNNENKSIELIMNVFVDDIETALNKDYQIDLQLNTKKELENSNVYFKKYLANNFKIKVNDELQKIHFIGKEYEGDIVYFYLEITDIKQVNTIEIENTILTNHFTEQKNLIKSKVNGAQKSLLLTKENNKGLLKF